MITHQYEEYKPVRQVWTWLLVLFLTAATLGWAMVTHMAVPNVPRHWDFDVLPDTPAESPYSTVPPPSTRTRPTQMERAPQPLHPESQQP
jgi:DNA-binding transcriptional LysR family regulator